MQSHGAHTQKACEEAAGNETFEECCTQKKLVFAKAQHRRGSSRRKTIHNSYFQDSKDHKIERTWRDKKGNCEKLNISCGFSAKIQNRENSYVEC